MESLTTPFTCVPLVPITRTLSLQRRNWETEERVWGSLCLPPLQDASMAL